MSEFEKVRFHGAFRDYQRRVLDNMDEYLKNGKINIVAAPGSGKTVLGLELIRRIGEPCIIFSPTTSIRQQWGERFRELFLDDKEDFTSLFSNDLHTVRLINSVTYQALYTAVEKVSVREEQDTDCSDIDLFATMKEYGVKTICLDEAHHLKNEWQKALEKFVSALDCDVKIVSLTATPPYDADGSEWNRYTEICGEIDEEIFVPELVGQNTLCPHQDYVYFNYPTKAETDSFEAHKKHVAAALEEIGELPFVGELCQRLNGTKDYEILFSSVKEYVALLVLFRHYGLNTAKKLVRELTAGRGLPSFKVRYAERAIGFLLEGEQISEKEKQTIIGILKKNSVYEKRKVTFCLTEKLKRSLVSSVGKLDSVGRIVKSEIGAMGKKLRMLVLTDYIKKENLSKIVTAEDFNSVNVVSIFETIRRGNPSVRIGVLSGSLVVLPQEIDLTAVKHRKEEIVGTDYCVVDFSGETHRSVDFVGKLFERGELQILIGTKSLLGEGWDSPCINSLILASFVGSFVLSNQMRGRAIRIDKNNPDKSANIWHLVTVEPEYLFKEKTTERVKEYFNQDYNELNSYDFDVLKRRFDAFMGPNYTTGVVESGIERITAIRPPYDKNGIEEINREMLSLSENRAEVAEQWRGEVADGKFAVAVESDFPAEKRVPVFTFRNFGLTALIAVAAGIAAPRLYSLAFEQSNLFAALGALAVTLVFSLLFFWLVRKIILYFNPAKCIKTLSTAVYRTLCECGLISSSAKLETKAHKQLFYVEAYLRNASVHDQNVFNTAMAEMLSPIENPRYIVIGRRGWKGYNYALSFACPSVIGRKKEYAETLARNLKGGMGRFEVVYTHREEGRAFILKCRKRSYITFNESSKIGKKYKVSHFE